MDMTQPGGVSVPCDPEDPRSRIAALASLAEALSRSAGTDPAECVMSLLTAAAKISLEQSEYPDYLVERAEEVMRDALDAARGFWPAETLQ